MEDRNGDELLRSVAMQDARSILETRQRAEQELVRLLEFHDVVLATMVEGLYAVDANGLVTYMNQAAEQLLGFTCGELLGRNMHSVTHHKHPDGTLFPIEECAGFRVLRHGNVLRDHDDMFIKKDGN